MCGSLGVRGVCFKCFGVSMCLPWGKVQVQGQPGPFPVSSYFLAGKPQSVWLVDLLTVCTLGGRVGGPTRYSSVPIRFVDEICAAGALGATRAYDLVVYVLGTAVLPCQNTARAPECPWTRWMGAPGRVLPNTTQQHPMGALYRRV